MPRGNPAFSRALTGLVTGALLITTLQFTAAPATAADDAAPDRSTLVESALEHLPPPPGSPRETAVRPDLVEAARPIDAPAGEIGRASCRERVL